MQIGLLDIWICTEGVTSILQITCCETLGPLLHFCIYASNPNQRQGRCGNETHSHHSTYVGNYFLTESLVVKTQSRTTPSHSTQPPDDPDNEETLTADQISSPQQTFPSRTRRRRTATIRHSMHHGEKRPWRDPDVHPKDTHFKYTDLESGISRYVQISSFFESVGLLGCRPFLQSYTTALTPENTSHVVLFNRMLISMLAQDCTKSTFSAFLF